MSSLLQELSDAVSAVSASSDPQKSKDELQDVSRKSVFVSYEERLPQLRKNRKYGAKRRDSGEDKISTHVTYSDNNSGLVEARDRTSKNSIVASSPSQSVPAHEGRVSLPSAHVLRGSQFSRVAGGGMLNSPSQPLGREGDGTAHNINAVQMNSGFALDPEDPIINFIVTEDSPATPSRQ